MSLSILMFLIKNPSKISGLLFPAVFGLSSCQISEQWASSPFSQNSTMNYAPSRPAPPIPVGYPVANPVPVPQRGSVAAVERPSVLGISLPSFRSNQQATAIRDTQPSWAQPVETFTAARSAPAPVLAPAPIPVFQPRPQPTPVFQSPPQPATKGKVRLVNGLAIAPPDAPPVVHRAVAAGNRLQKMPYKWGGGHAKLNDNGYDCSGTVSYVLRESGLMKDQMTSRGFFNYGESGKGEWITVWVRDGHVFMIIGGLRLDTGGSSQRTGPRWKTKSRSYKGLVPRHPAGL